MEKDATPKTSKTSTRGLNNQYLQISTLQFRVRKSRGHPGLHFSTVIYPHLVIRYVSLMGLNKQIVNVPWTISK